jgi:hypothetical protein
MQQPKNDPRQAGEVARLNQRIAELKAALYYVYDNSNDIWDDDDTIAIIKAALRIE